MTEKNVYQKMVAVTGAVERVEKGDNKVNNQYRFVSHDAVMAALRPQFVEQGLVVLPTVTSRAQDGNRTEVDICVSIINAERPDDKVDLNFFGYGIDSQDKGPGKAISYALKYALLKAFSLETGDDPDADANSKHEPAQQPKQAAPQKAAPKGDSELPHVAKAREIASSLKAAPHREAINSTLKSNGLLDMAEGGWVLKEGSHLKAIQEASQDTFDLLVTRASEAFQRMEKEAA